ncbi:serine/threonine-protein kinase [Actinoplanes oblitus]|uniref:serine/threonine-protein kinase n=1 Tax=Actinoplanes oblitus TaxID=3040509 RepID=UPI002E1BA5FF
MLAPGIVLNGRYQLNQRVAAGGMGEVWRGEDLLLRREVAVKVLLPALMNDSEFITRFRSEARMMAQLRHPGIVQVYDYGENAVVDGERFDYLVMEFIDGTSLSKKIQQAGRLSPAETMSIMAGMADALHAAHQAGIIHRDVKPSNLLVRPGGALVLVDFGIARSVGISGITSTNVVMGSAHYMAPEQAEGLPVTAATDVYALGAVAFTCLAGRPPYVGDNPLAVLAQLVHGQPPVLPPDVPRPVASVVLRALAKDPAQRFPSGAALADAARSAGRPAGGPGGWGTQTVRQQMSAPTFPTFPVQQQGGGFPPGSATPQGGFSGAATPQGGFSPTGTPSGGYSSTGTPQGGFASGSGGFSGGATPGSGVRAAPPSRPDKSGKSRNLALIGGALVLVFLGVGIMLATKPDMSEAGDQGGPVGGIEAQGGGDQQVQDPTGDDVLPAPNQTRKNGKRDKDQKPKPGTSQPSPDPVPSQSPSESPSTDPATAGPEETEEPNRYRPTDVCGNDFTVADQHNLKSAAGVVKGKIFLLYRASDGANCVVTLRTAGLDRKGAASAYLEVQGKGAKTDSGSFQYYAGPVTAVAKATCVKWGGSVGALSWTSGFEHCG